MLLDGLIILYTYTLLQEDLCNRLYCLFFRGIHPIGWNIANGGCNNLEELLNPSTTIMRELREELIIINSSNWYIFKSNDSTFYDRPEFALARQFWDLKFDELSLRRFELKGTN